ncbi:MAG: DoxX family protein [Prolixibacteraceae bacterium]
MKTSDKVSATISKIISMSVRDQNLVKLFFTLTRVFIGWHFLYEGLSKVFSHWSSSGYLMGSQWLFSGFFHWIAETPEVLRVVDILNIAGLILLGVGLFVGLFTRVSAFTGALLILFYYIANPPFIGYMGEATGEGHYLIVNKQLIEMAVLLVIVFLPQDFLWSIDRWIARIRQRREDEKEVNQLEEGPSGRREIIKDLVALPVLGGFSWILMKKRKWESYEELSLVSENSRVNAISGATTQVEFAKLSELNRKVPTGKIKDYEISRLIYGGAILCGYCHSRDLIYVSPLTQAYFNDEKVIETLKLCEAVGINTMFLRVDNNTLKMMKKYRKRGGNIQWVAQCKITEENINADIDAAIANGAIGIQLQGSSCDHAVRANKINIISRAIEYVQKQDQIICGVSSHNLEVVVACEKRGLNPDFYMKTFNSNSYWTAGPRIINDPSWKPDPAGNIIVPEYDGIYEDPRDNMWCNTPEQTKEFMKNVEKPWVAFKTLGAGAIHPKEGFKYAFNNGADFACVGMFDFQLVENANIVCETLSNISERKRPWRG